MNTAEKIEQLIKQSIDCQEFYLDNESHIHSGPATESHYKLVTISDDFSSKSKIQRHKLIYKTIDELMKNPIHAITLHLFTVDEWAVKEDKALLSPKCLGG